MQLIAYWATNSLYLTVRAIFLITIVVLVRKWLQASPRYYSDLPFILAVSFVFLTYDRIDSVLGLTGILPITVASQLINLFGFLVIICLNLLIMLVIWMPERKRLRATFIIAWFSLWIVLISIFMGTIGSPDTLHSILAMMGLPIILLLTITWFFCYFQKRLSNIHPLIVGIGFAIYLISMFVRIYVSLAGAPIGYVFTDLHWIPGILDVIGWSIVLVGFSREATY